MTAPDERELIDFRRGDRSSNATVIVFSSVNANGFSFYNLFEKCGKDINRIYVRDPFDLWYTKGISAEIPSWDALITRIASICVELGSSRLMVFGSSMGAYAALRCSLDLNVDLCVVTSPQTLLDPRLPHTPSEEVDSSGRDISSLLAEPNDTQYVVFFGAADFVDIFNVMRVKWTRQVPYPVAGQDHLVAQYLAKAGVYERLIDDFSQDKLSHVEKILANCGVRMDLSVLDPIIFELTRRVVESRYLGGHRPAIPMLRALEALGPFADGHHIHAQILASKGNLDQAVAQARVALELAPTSVTVADTLAEMLRRAGKKAEAITAYEHCLRLRAKHYSALCALGELNAEVGDMAKATNYLEMAAAIRPRLKRAQSIAAKFGLTSSKLEHEGH